MKLHNLTKLQGLKKKQRVGRGNGSGRGTYCGRGCKGMGQRKSGNVRPGFEGGQTPLLRRIPKLKGFRNPTKIYFQVINIKDIAEIELDSNLNNEWLYENHLISKKELPVKLLGVGEIKKKLLISKEIQLSKTAKEKIIKAGGQVGV